MEPPHIQDFVARRMNGHGLGIFRVANYKFLPCYGRNASHYNTRTALLQPHSTPKGSAGSQVQKVKRLELHKYTHTHARTRSHFKPMVPCIVIKCEKNPTRCNSMQIFIYCILLYMFRVSQRPSSGVLKTVTAASGTGHNTGTATSLQRGPIRPHWRVVVVPVPEAAVTGFITPDDGCCDTRNM